MRKLFIGFIMIFISQITSAQDSSKISKPKAPIPVEVFTGNSRLYYQVFINRKITKNNKIGFFSNSSFSADYKKDFTKNEYQTTSALYVDLFKGLSVNAGATFNSSEGLKPFAGLQYMYANKSLLIFYLPSYYYLQSNKVSNLAIIEFKPKINQKWSIYSRIQVFNAYNIEKNNHARRYVYSRLGLSFANYTFGLASNIDWYGASKFKRENYGMFFRVNI